MRFVRLQERPSPFPWWKVSFGCMIFLMALVVFIVSATSTPQKCGRVVAETFTYGYGTCVVGNGPLSDNDRRNISHCETVVRFNDLRNMQRGERVDVHVIREWKDTDVYAGSFFDGCFNTSVVCIGKRACKQKRNILTTGVYRRDVFRNCTQHSVDVNKHPSTGTIYLSWLQEHANVKRIDVFGMNWNMPLFQHSANEASIVHACCSKCVIHPTPSSSYT